ncbi:MAG: DUF3613 domain-containing protein [Methylomonas sp.]
MRHFYPSLLIAAALNASSAFAELKSQALMDTYLPETEQIALAPEIAVPQEADTQTQLWLQLQESGAMAGSRYKLPGQAATLIYQRYLGSFSYPIPEHFEVEDNDSGGSSGSSTGR